MRCVTEARFGLVASLFALASAGCEVDASGLADGLFAPTFDAGSSTSTNAGARDASVPSPPSSPPATLGGDDAGTGAVDAADDASAPPDADLPDVILDADASGGAVDPCDLDQDGYRANSSACGGNDCCDDDGRAYPGEASYFSTTNACGSFDYDCDGVEAMQFGIAMCQVSGFSCTGDGFQSVTACGATATFETCSQLFTCGGVGAPKTQACR